MYLQGETLLEVNGLSKTFTSPYKSNNSESVGTGFRLSEISFKLNRGESICIIGLNGSGKSTLLKILSGISLPDSGYAKINGSSLSVLDIGTGFHPDLTGLENIKMLLGLKQIDKAKHNNIVAEVVSFSELEAHIDLPLKHYSSGMYLRLAMSIMFSINVELMIIDEVISVGDVNFQQKCINALMSKIEAGASVVLATHDMRLAEVICERCIWIDNGTIVNHGESSSVISSFIQKNYSLPQSQNADLKSIVSDVNHEVLQLLYCKVMAVDKLQPITEITDIEIEFAVNKKIEEPLMMGLVICDKLHNPIVGLTPLRSLKKNVSGHFVGKGTFVCSVKVPAYFLNRNLFILSLFFENSKGENVLKKTISSFIVEHVDHTYNQSDYVYKGEFSGPIYTPLEWTVVRKD